MSGLIEITSGALTAAINSFGAELTHLRDGDGRELMTDADPAFWTGHAPILFPIVGRLKNDTLRHNGKTYPMTQHGFARDRRFAWVERGPRSCKLALIDDAQTRARYPFAFRLEVTYTVDGAALDVGFDIVNTGDETLPASLGGHPAFNWPLQPGVAKESYALTFANAESSPVRRLDGGLLRAAPEPSPVQGAALPLSDSLFVDDAIIFDRIESRSVRYAAGPGATAGPSLKMSWQGFRELGVWSKPSGAPFLCIEPWRGYASPAGFDGEFSDKPGLMHIAPGAEERLSFRIEVASS